MEINLGLTQLSLLCTIVRHQGVITAARLSWKATAKIAAFFFLLLLLFLSPSPLFDFYGSLQAKYGAWRQILRRIFYPPGFCSSLRLRAGRETMTCCQFCHKTTKSLVFHAAVDSRRQNAIKSTDSWVNLFLYSLQMSCFLTKERPVSHTCMFLNTAS